MGIKFLAFVDLGFGVWGKIWVDVKIMVPFLGTLNIRCRIIIRTQKGTILSTTTHMKLLLAHLNARHSAYLYDRKEDSPERVTGICRSSSNRGKKKKR